jgi:hypothetical protein
MADDSSKATRVVDGEFFYAIKEGALRSGPGGCIRGGARRKNSWLPLRRGPIDAVLVAELAARDDDVADGRDLAHRQRIVAEHLSERVALCQRLRGVVVRDGFMQRATFLSPHARFRVVLRESIVRSTRLDNANSYSDPVLTGFPTRC